jgi:D-xylose 1-dehydrogenase
MHGAEPAASVLLRAGCPAGDASKEPRQHHQPVVDFVDGAIVGLTRTLAHECGSHGIRVNAVLPGAIATEKQRRLVYTPAYKAEILARQALKREILPEDVARLVLFLAADDSSAITNQNYVVDGGWV